ncbi:hypothetical protein B0H14DRAFT_3537332 [Mycena olivaceomarginata]|nr:hypothetical protein B0H14DRAFT_3537332 [Mycena olivaceomarginata]
MKPLWPHRPPENRTALQKMASSASASSSSASSSFLAALRTERVEIPDIHATRTALRCPASRKFPDGSDYHMLPMLQDTTPGAKVILGDSLDIATRHRLDYSSPHIHDAVGTAREATALDLANYAHFNTHVDTTFFAHVGLTAPNMARAFPPASAVRTKALFAERVGVSAWDDLIGAFADAEKRAGIFRAFDTGITGLARMYLQKEGPFLEGQTPRYADLIFLEQEEWAEFCTRHGGVFGRLHEVLRRQYWEVR